MIRYPLKILLVENNADQIFLTEKAFRRSGAEVQILSVSDGAACLKRLAGEGFSIVILDYHLPGQDGTELIKEIRQRGFEIPIIMVTGQGDEQIAVRAMKNGANDYIVKTQGYFGQLPLAVERAIETSELQSRLRESEDRYRRLTENANDLIFIVDESGVFSFLTSKVKQLLDYSVGDLLGRNIREVLSPSSQARVDQLLRNELNKQSPVLAELDFITRSGATKSFELSLTPLSKNGRRIGFEAIGRDFTQRLELERQIRQSNRELTTLLSVSAAVTHSLNVEEVSGAALQQIAELKYWTCGAIVTLKFSDSSFRLSASLNLTPSLYEGLTDEALLMETMESLNRLPSAVTDKDIQDSPTASSFARFIEVCRQHRIQSYVLLPLRFKERLLGFVFGGCHQCVEFRRQEIDIINSIGTQISTAIANAQLFDAIREAKTEWETTFDAMSELICSQDVDGRIIRVNKALARRLNLEPREVVGSRAVEVFKDPLSAWCQHQKLERYEADKIIAVEVEDNLLNGYFEIASSPVYSPDGQLLAWLFVGKDITEQRRLQNQIVQVERLKALGEMASGVAHDFNNVLAGILGKAQVMLAALDRSNVPDEQTLKSNLKIIEKTAIQGAQTVRRIQDFTRIRTDQNFREVDVNQVIHESINTVRPMWRDQCESKGVQIDLQFTPGDVPAISGIDSELADVFINIITNSIDAMPDGGGIQITTRLDQSEGRNQVEIEISDTGVGMSNEVKSKIFDPFFSTKGPKGTGLGMSVAYGIVSRHHGSIGVESELGVGTTCRLTFPPAKRAERVIQFRNAAMENQKIRILVIDDEDVIRDFLAEMFGAVGYEAEVAATGQQGLALFEAHHYDLVFSDLGLPGMSGWDVSKRIRALNDRVPIILLSGWGIQVDDVRLKECGVTMVLSKPCQMDELLDAVEKALKGQQRSQE